MESYTKIKLTAETIEALTRKAIGLGAFGAGDKRIVSVAEMTNGCYGAVYSLKLDNMEAVLKVSPPDGVTVMRYEKDIMKAEVDALRLVENIGLPVPGVYFYDNTRQLGDFEYFFMEKMRGEPLNTVSEGMSREESAKIEREIGVINRKINEIRGTAFGYFSRDDKQTGGWGTAFYSIVADVIADARDAGAILPYDKIEDILREFIYTCDGVNEPRLIHWDLWPGNVLVENGEITGIIDFERALWADPLMEYCFSETVDNAAFCAGYGIDLDELGENAKIRRKLYDLYMYLIWKTECYYRHYDMPQAERADALIQKTLGDLYKPGIFAKRTMRAGERTKRLRGFRKRRKRTVCPNSEQKLP